MNRAVYLFVALLCCAGVMPEHSAKVTIVAENYQHCQDIALELIRGVGAPGCTGGRMLVGLDFPDEWTQYTLYPGDYGDFNVTMKSRGDAGVTYTLRLKVTGNYSGESQTIDLMYGGVGYG
jgi:hypothetical protein